MKTEKCRGCLECGQLELIQRIGRIGYWEYDHDEKQITLTEASLGLLSAIAGVPCSTFRSLMDVLNALERKRFQAALDQAVSNRLPFNIELKLASSDGKTSCILVCGAPIERSRGLPGFAGTLQDITNEKHREADHEKLITQLQALLDFPAALFAKGWAHFEEQARFNVNRGEYGPGDAEEQVQAVVTPANNFQAHHIERQRPNERWLEIGGTPIPSGGFVTSHIDIPERKLTETELLHAKEVAEAQREQVASLLDNSGQGFLSFGADLIVAAEYSRTCEAMLGESPAGRNAAGLFFHEDAAQADFFDQTIASVLAESDTDIRESMLSLLPTEIQRDELWLKAEYKILDNGKFMVVLTDITAERQMAAMLDSERCRLELIVMAVSDSRNFFDTINGFREFLAQDLPRIIQGNAAPQVVAKELYREIHTYKGLLSQFSFPGTPGVLHCLESALSDALADGESLTRQQIAQLFFSETLQAAFEKDLLLISDALGEEFLRHGESFVLSESQALQLETLAARLLRGEMIDTSVAEIRQLLEAIGTLRKVSFRDVLTGFDGLVSQTAKRLGKKVAPIVVSGGGDVWIDPNVYRPFLRSLVHVFRNAMAHGIETPEARWEAEKDEVGKITCRVMLDGRKINLSIEDDGGGINLAGLRQRAVAVGIYDADDVLAVPDDDIAKLIFMDSISTQKEVTALAGRGVGLAAVLSETIAMGGEVMVKTVAGQGTEFRFVLPLAPESRSLESRPC